MKEDTKQDYEELKRQDRKFLWGLIAFVLTTCIGGILYLVNQAPNPTKNGSPMPPNDPIVKPLAEEEAKRVKTETALEELMKLAKECQSIDTEVLQILREILKNPAEQKLEKNLLSRLRELEKQRTIKTAQLDNLSFVGLFPGEAEKLEADRNQARELNKKAEAFIKRLKSQLAIDNQ